MLVDIAIFIFSLSFLLAVLAAAYYSFKFVKPKEPPRVDIHLPQLPERVSFELMHRYPEQKHVEISKEDKEYLEKIEKEEQKNNKEATEEYHSMIEATNAIVEKIIEQGGIKYETS